MKKETWSFGLSIIAVIISILSLCAAFYRTPTLGIDYQGIIVGILSLLITILIGWQIYNVIYLKNELRKEVLNLSKQTIEQTKIELLNSQLNTLYGLQEGAIRSGDINYILSTIDVIMDIIIIDLRDKNKADRVLETIEALFLILSSKSKLEDMTKDKFNMVRERIKELSSITEKAFETYNNTKVII